MSVASRGNDTGSVSARREPMSFVNDSDDPVGAREHPTGQVDAHDAPCHLLLGSPSVKEFSLFSLRAELRSRQLREHIRV